MYRSDRDMRAMNMLAIDSAVAAKKQSVRLCLRDGAVSALLREPLRPGQRLPEMTHLVYVLKVGGTIRWQRRGWWILETDGQLSEFVRITNILKQMWHAVDNPPPHIPTSQPTDYQRAIAEKHLCLAKRILTKRN